MTNDFENWLDDVRAALYESTKAMKTQDAVSVINASGRKIAEKYGIPVVKAKPIVSERYSS